MAGFTLTRSRGAKPPAHVPGRVGAALLALLLMATSVAAQPAPNAAMPKSVQRFTDNRSDCFLPNERQDYDAWIDQFRVTLPGCDEGVIPPQKTIQSFRVYKQGSNRVIDCSTLRQNEFGTRFLDTYLDDVTSRTDAAAKSPAAATCAANMLYAWAKADAMTELGDKGHDRQSALQINWTSGGLAAAYFTTPAVQAAAKQVSAPGGTADDAIRAWFHKLAGPISQSIDAERAAKNEDNLQYWRAFAILPTAFLTEDPKLMAQSRRVFDTALSEVTMGSKDPANDGYLPLEMERGPRALHYQTYASMPILALGLLSEAQGCGFLGGEDQRDRLVLLLSRVLEGRADPDLFSAQAARYSKNGKAPEQLRTATVRDSGQLLYLAKALDPAIAAAVDANLSAATGEPSPVIKPGAGAKRGLDRLGGAFAGLAAAAKTPGPPPAALAPVCRADG